MTGTDDPFSIRATDVSPINKGEVKSILTTQMNEEFNQNSDSQRLGDLHDVNNPARLQGRALFGQIGSSTPSQRPS